MTLLTSTVQAAIVSIFSESARVFVFRRELEMSEFIKHRLLSNLLDEFDISTSPYQYMNFLKIDDTENFAVSDDLLHAVATVSSNIQKFFTVASQIQHSSELGPLLIFLDYFQILKKQANHLPDIADSLRLKNECNLDLQYQVSFFSCLIFLFLASVRLRGKTKQSIRFSIFLANHRVYFFGRRRTFILNACHQNFMNYK